jgi:hypothetical protein
MDDWMDMGIFLFFLGTFASFYIVPKLKNHVVFFFVIFFLRFDFGGGINAFS